MAFVCFYQILKTWMRRFDVILELESMPKEKKIQNIKKLFSKKI